MLIFMNFILYFLWNLHYTWSHLEYGSLLGHVCKDPGGVRGTCVERRDCVVTVADSPGSFVHPLSLCGHHGTIPLFCCRDRPIEPPKETEQRYIIPIQDQLTVAEPLMDFDCGIISPDDPPNKLTEPVEEVNIWGFIVPSVENTSNIGNNFNDSISIMHRKEVNTWGFIVPSVENISNIGNNFNLSIFARHRGRTSAGDVTYARRSFAKYMALIAERQDDGTIQHLCGGALINKQWVLTAAHCLESITVCYPRTKCLVRLGEYNTKTTFDGQHEDFSLAEIKFHDDSRSNIAYHDLALVKLDRMVTFKSHINPVCLPWGVEAFKQLVGTELTFTGWGARFLASVEGSAILREGNVTVIDVLECEKSYNIMPDFNTKWPRGMTSSNTLCAIDPDGTMDPCNGDSGGPAVYINDQQCVTLAGIISLGSGCGNNVAGVYVPVARPLYLSWIKHTAFA